MSYYYTYYAGYIEDGKMYPLGPYDNKGKLHPILSKSRSFASNLHDDFYRIPEDMITDEMRKEFSYEDWKGNIVFDASYLPIEELPSGSFIKNGYFLIKEVEAYEQEKGLYPEDCFSEPISPFVYNAMVMNEIKFGTKEKEYDEEGYEIENYNASDYMYYAFPDYGSEEYEAARIKEAIDSLEVEYPRQVKYVVIKTEG